MDLLRDTLDDTRKRSMIARVGWGKVDVTTAVTRGAGVALAG